MGRGLDWPSSLFSPHLCQISLSFPQLCLSVCHLRVQPLSSLSFQRYPFFSCPHSHPLQIFSLNLPLNLPQGIFSFSWRPVIKPLDKVSSADLYEGHSGEINCAEDEGRLQEEMLALAKDTGTLGTAPPLREWWTCSFWVTATHQYIILNRSIWLQDEQAGAHGGHFNTLEFNFNTGCWLA